MRCVSLVVLAACGAAVPPLPSKGGPAWNELVSEHFTLWTDAGTDRGRALIREMEHLHQVVFGVAFPGLPTAGRSFVIALRDSYEVGAYVPEQFTAFSWPAENPLLQPVIVFAADTNSRDGHVVTHELTHVISHVPIHRQPAWFAEGIAQFFETVKLDTDKAVVDVGEPLQTQVEQVRHLSLVSGEQLFACEKLECRDDRFYMTSALLFAYLANTHPTELVRYEERLAEVDHAHAWAEVFPTLTAEQLDRELRAWAVQGRHRIWHFKVELAEPAIAQRTLPDADVLAARALLRYSFHADAAAADIATALAADPTDVIARLLERDRTKTIGADDARATAAAHPLDWRAWVLVLRAQHGGPDALAARDKICALADPAAMLPADLCPSAHALDAVPGAGEHGGQPVVPQ